MVAWILVVVSIVLSTLFTLFYGIQFGDEKARKWLTSMIISIFTSILITQPIKVIQRRSVEDSFTVSSYCFLSPSSTVSPIPHSLSLLPRRHGLVEKPCSSNSL